METERDGHLPFLDTGTCTEAWWLIGLHSLPYGLSFIHHFHSIARAECDNSLPFSEYSSIPLCCILFPSTLLHQLFFHPPSPHLAIYFLVYVSILLFPNSYIILFWEFYFLPYSVHTQTNVIYLTLPYGLWHN